MVIERQGFTVPEASAYLGISPRLGWRLVQEGKFPVKVKRIGERVIVPKALLDRYLESEAA